MTPVIFALAAAAGGTTTCLAAEFDIVGQGSFKTPTTGRLASLPTGLPFSKDDVASGTWAFLVRYEGSAPDADPDPDVGRYAGAIRSIQLTVGSTTIALPTESAELVVSDGGLGFTDRESIRVKASSATPFGVLRFSWIQNNQALNRMGLRGAPGSLASDALPTPSVLADLTTSSRFDKFMVLEWTGPQSQTQPQLYISSSKVTVVAKPAATQ